MKLLFNSTILMLLFTSNSLLAQGYSVGMLSDEELIPFCSNELIWKPANINTEQCMKAARPCSAANANSKMNVVEATQALYACVFKKLDVKMNLNFDTVNGE